MTKPATASDATQRDHSCSGWRQSDGICRILHKKNMVKASGMFLFPVYDVLEQTCDCRMSRVMWSRHVKDTKRNRSPTHWYTQSRRVAQALCRRPLHAIPDSLLAMYLYTTTSGIPHVPESLPTAWLSPHAQEVCCRIRRSMNSAHSLLFVPLLCSML